MFFVLAECENVESSIKFEFFDNNIPRIDINLGMIMKPFLANICDGLRDKPKIIMIHVSCVWS